MVFDFHEAVIVNGGRAGDDANDGGGDFFPGVEFFPTRQGAQFEKPGPERVDVEGFAVEFGLYSGFALSRSLFSVRTSIVVENIRSSPTWEIPPMLRLLVDDG